ncbi:uncharacterized protein LOC143673299 [Tamandua tetradactyla]|uniref:uncharacterized protein LOC143673299 n=1 Tax=Tamandua tetradactyla TaxID=48850 RepID=UPI0040540B13
MKKGILVVEEKLKVTYAVQCEHKEMVTTQGITNSCKDTSQFGSPLKTINSACEEKCTSSVSEYFSCVSFLPMPSCGEFSDLTKESPEPGPSGLFQYNRQMAEKDPNSEYHSCASSEDNPIHTESSKFQEDASQPGPVMVSVWTQTARENYSDSEYSSSASKITPDEDDEIYQLQHGGLSLGSSEMPQPQDSEQEE